MKTHIIIMLLAFGICLIAGCQDQKAIVELEALKARVETEAQNKAIVKRWISEVDRENFDIVDELIAEDCKVYYSGETYGREWLRASCEAITQSFSEGTHTIDDLIAEKDKVVVRLTVKVTHTGEFMGILSTGKKLEYHGFTVYRIVEGKIRELWMDHNATLELMVKLGVALKPKSVGE
jgi:predicted ester cyclase